MCWLLTPFIFRLAYMERGYSAIGGEIVFPLIPLLAWIVVKTIKDSKTDKTPACYGKYRSPQSDAENCCFDCESDRACFDETKERMKSDD